MGDSSGAHVYVYIGLGIIAIVAATAVAAWARRRKSPHRQAEAGGVEGLHAWLAEGGGVDTRDRSGMTPLHHAALNNQLEAAELLLGAGADVNATSQDDLTPTYVAAVNGFVEMVELLLAHEPREIEKALDVTSWQAGDMQKRGGELRGQDARVIRALMAYGGHDVPEGDDPEALLAAVKARRAAR